MDIEKAELQLKEMAHSEQHYFNRYFFYPLSINDYRTISNILLAQLQPPRYAQHKPACETIVECARNTDRHVHLEGIHEEMLVCSETLLLVTGDFTS